MTSPPPTPPASRRGVFEIGLQGLCPRCGARTLFAGAARFAPACRARGLDFSAFNGGEVPAAFLSLIVGGLITALAITLELAAEPPFWVHVLLWLPLTALLVIGSLRVAKGMLLASEYRNDAQEGRVREK